MSFKLNNSKKTASTAVTFDNKTISFNDPDGLVDLILAVRAHSIIADALRVPLDQNRDLACSQTDLKPRCGYMQPDIVGAIFSPDIYISALYL